MIIYNKKGEAIIYDDSQQEILKISENNEIKKIKSNIICSDWSGRSFAIDKNWNLLLNNLDKKIKIYRNFGEKEEIEIEIRDISGMYIKDYRPIEKSQVVLLTDDGYVSIYSYNFLVEEDVKEKGDNRDNSLIEKKAEEEEYKSVSLDSVYHIQLSKDEIATSLAICSLGKYVLISSRAVSGFYQRGLFILKIEGKGDKMNFEKKISNSRSSYPPLKLVFLTKMEFSVNPGCGNFHAICIPFYIDDQPVCFGLQQYGEGTLCSYILKEKDLIEFFKPIQNFSEFENFRFEIWGNCVYNMNKRGQLQLITWKKIG